MNVVIFLFFILFSLVALGGDGGMEDPELRVVISGKTMDGCSFLYSPVDFCDERHSREISEAYRRGKINFFGKYILISIVERAEYQQSSVVVIDKASAEVYPLPIDSYSGKRGASSGGILLFNSEDNKICVVGDILVYRSIKSGRFCFFLEDKGFSGYKTEYMK